MEGAQGRGRRGAIAFVVPDFSEAYGLSCCAMEERCTEHGINLSCGGPDVWQYGGGARAV